MLSLVQRMEIVCVLTLKPSDGSEPAMALARAAVKDSTSSKALISIAQEIHEAATCQ